VTLLRITASHFVAGVVVGERAAPIVRYMRRWSVEKIRTCCDDREWALEEVETCEASASSPPQLSLRLDE